MAFIGIYSGSFNPIHIAHLALANYVYTHTHLDELWLLPSPLNPLKTMEELLPYEERCRMIGEAIAEDSRFALCTIEAALPRPNYTVHTLQALSVLYPEHQFALIIGADNWMHFDQWYFHRRILIQCPLVVYPRPGVEIDPTTLPEGAVYLADAPMMEISSSQIREAKKTGQDLRHWLPNPHNWKTLEYESR